MEYTLIRSKRRTVGLQVRDGKLIVRAPVRMSLREIEKVLAEHTDWIASQLRRSQEILQAAGEPLTEQELKILLRQAKEVFTERVAYYAPLVGVTYGRITIRTQHTRWGSCSAQGNLNFNGLLMLAPPETLDSVVVHELCHRKYMDHSREFYAEVYRVFPEYRKWHSWLKINGGTLMAKLPADD